MSKKINILDDITINKIAAGEVVERPSSVTKELIENSIDANSTQIVIDITDGGKKQIRITDNGSGILSSEVDKSFLRHATSKIKKIDDLYDLYSLGFRGEALASIASVSRLEMITKTKEEPIGTKVILEGGKEILKEPVGTKNGTTIIIKDLFFNTPARQKFLKSTHAETINISDLINKLAIGNTDIQFKYINNGKLMLNTPGDGKLISVIRSIYGKEIVENLIKINEKGEYCSISGYIGNNNIYRSNKNLQHIYINNRFVKSKIILDAINESYKSIIPINKHGICFLNIDINPSKIDVNIHPTKMEIKFENDKDLYIEIRDLLKRKLLNTALIGKYESYDRKPIVSENKEVYLEKKEEALNTVISNKINSTTPIEKLDDDNKFMSFEEALNKGNNKKDHNESLNSNDKKEDIKLQHLENKKGEYFIDGNIDLSKSFTFDELETLSNLDNKSNHVEIIKEENVIKNENRFSITDFRVVGSILNTYIVLEKNNSMYLLDQHAAHEKVLYEEYMKKFKSHKIDMQMLLDPIVVEISNVDMLNVESNLDLFLNFGFEIELFGNNHIMIRGVPTIFGNPESEKFILQIIDNIEDLKNSYDLKGDKFASMACRAAIKANDKIHTMEMKKLLSQMELCDNPFTCPHGRPTIVEISKKEIEKMFKRIM
ncbi:DNA mismatch repair endonuclease MutL [Terrisporobacter mayombei]|uniref:DNA mismatch repair protein MutL n=1 Tax=Terrisporobacter mayombei TaxID=1541 RepID=A0ABY9PY19_9FIRM|nr:DNA mismatch repair endonuclease MutL [Terrisporobacter mayombei]MCC3868451.1 DNA mismatch repair endonuclease MutL [Terrisporobacter mayombei]WMT80603.1 DNA mismatch repair protein MutL [Terrisporobacter mayombei]